MTIASAILAIRTLLQLTGPAAGLLTPAAYLDTTFTQNVTTGTAAGQADIALALSGTIAASGTASIDLVGALTDAFGASVAVVKLKQIVLINTTVAPTDGQVRIKSSTTIPTGAGGTQNFNLRPGGMFALADFNTAGLCTLTATSADTLVLENLGAGICSYSIIFLATSA